MAKGYEYRINGGSWVDGGDNKSIVVPSLTSSTSYNFEARKRDSLGNESSASAVASGTTDSGGFTAFDKGFNFRSTSGFVTDGTDETYVILEAYPVTRNGVTFGWASISQVQDRNRSAAVDRRFAGLMFQDGSVAVDQRFQVDLPAAGTYDIHLALGDQANNFATAYSYKIYDNTSGTPTLKNTISGASLTAAAATFRDAANAGPFSIANWPGSNTAISVTFASTTMYLDLVYSGSGIVVPIAHMRIVRTA